MREGSSKKMLKSYDESGSSDKCASERSEESENALVAGFKTSIVDVRHIAKVVRQTRIAIRPMA